VQTEENLMEAKEQFDNSAGTSLLELPSDRLATSTHVWVQVCDVMRKDVVTICPDETLVTAAKMMAEKNVSSVVVVDDSAVVGIITETDLVRRVAVRNSNFHKMKVDMIMSSPVEVARPDSSAFEAGIIMETKHIKRLPILSDKQLVGVVTQNDLTRILSCYGLCGSVAQIMSRDVAVVPRKATVAEAAKIMASRNISCVAILDDGEAVGVFTEADLLKRVVATKRNPAATKMEEVMSSCAMSVPPDYSILSAKKTMEDTNIQTLVVTDGKKLRGIVTRTDLFMAIKNKLRAEEEKNLGILAKSKSNIYTMTMDGKITYVNPAFMKLLGVSSPADLVDRSFLPQRFWGNPNDGARFLKKLGKGAIETTELALKTSEGKTIYVTCFSTLTKNVHGEINGIQGILHDITDRKLAEDSLKDEIIKRKQAEAKLREHKRKFKINPRVIKKWHRAEDTYRKAAHAWQQQKSLDTIRKHLRNAVNEALAALKFAGRENSEFTEVQNLLKLLRSPKVAANKDLDQTRQVLNFLGSKIPPEAGLWHIEHRANDS